MCISTIRLKSGVDVPCSKCHECKQRYSSAWSFRLNQEMKIAGSAHFVTLTYSDKHLPLGEDDLPQLYYPDVQNFLKRLRKYEKGNTNIKYYAVGERGDLYERPHWHLLIFNASEKYIRKAWLDKGIIDVGKAEGGSISYILKYLHKENGSDYKIAMSKSLGKIFLSPSRIKYMKKKQLPYVRIENGVKIPLARFYKDIIWKPRTKEEKEAGRPPNERDRLSAKWKNDILNKTLTEEQKTESKINLEIRTFEKAKELQKARKIINHYKNH